MFFDSAPLADFYLYVPYYPQQEVAKLNDVHVNTCGSVVNTALVLKELGIKTSLVTNLGTDILGNLLHGDLTQAGIDLITSNTSGKTALTIIMVDISGERTMYSYNPQTISIDVLNDAEWAMAESDAFFTSCYEFIDSSSIEIIDRLLDICIDPCIEYGKIAVLDLSPLTKTIPYETWEKLLYKFSILIGTEQEFNDLLNVPRLNRGMLFQEYCLSKIYVKMGRQGSCCLTYEGKKHIGYVSPVSSKNLTGCGDAYNAGIIWGELNQNNIDKAVRIGNIAGIAVATLGFNVKKIASAILGEARQNRKNKNHSETAQTILEFT